MFVTIEKQTTHFPNILMPLLVVVARWTRSTKFTYVKAQLVLGWVTVSGFRSFDGVMELRYLIGIFLKYL